MLHKRTKFWLSSYVLFILRKGFSQNDSKKCYSALILHPSFVSEQFRFEELSRTIVFFSSIKLETFLKKKYMDIDKIEPKLNLLA